jgi:hypothetical protein
MSWWSDLVQAVAQSATGGAPSAAAAGSPAISAAGAIAAPGGIITVVEGIWAGLTDGKLWRSLGWLLLGVVLMLAGVLWWIGPSAARASPAGLAAGAGRRLAT